MSTDPRGGMICQGCGAVLAPSRTRPRVWCSDNCRKRAWDRTTGRGKCPCGALTATRSNQLCRACFVEVGAVGRAMREERIAAMWAQGLKQREIAAALGTTKGSIDRSMAAMRRRGWDLPRRYDWSPESIERQRETWRRRAA